jgi:hypothetical protein
MSLRNLKNQKLRLGTRQCQIGGPWVHPGWLLSGDHNPQCKTKDGSKRMESPVIKTAGTRTWIVVIL